MYEESLTAFHRALAAHAPSGFRASTAFAFRSVPWFSAEAGYLDGSVARTVEISNRAGLAVRVNYSAPQPERLVDEQDQANHIPFWATTSPGLSGSCAPLRSPEFFVGLGGRTQTPGWHSLPV